MTARTIVFDLDGTLVETLGDLADTLNVVLRSEGCDPLPDTHIRTMVGAGARALLKSGLEASFHAVTPERLDKLFDFFVAHYAANIAVRSHTLPGLDAALDALEARGDTLAVLTNKLEGLSVRLLDALDLSRRFRTVVGGDTFPFRKPDPRTFLTTVARVEGEPSLAVMIGDSKTDLDTARAAGVPCILVDFGYTEIPAAELGADRVISHWSELPAAIDAVMAPQTQPV